MKRPMIYWGILFVLGVWAGMLSTLLMVVGVCTVILLLVLGCYKIIKIKKNTLVLFLGVVFFLIGCVSMKYSNYKLEYCRQLENKECEFVGTVVSKEMKKNKSLAIIQGYFVDEDRLLQSICVAADQAENVQTGELVCIKGIVHCFSEGSNFGGFQEESYRLGNGIFCKIEQSSLIAVKRKPYALRLKLEELRDKIHSVFYQYFTKERASVACAMILGEKQELDREIKELYQRNGISHLIAISGLHIAMIGGVLYRLIKKLTGRFVVSALGGSLFIVLYGIMTGLAGSTLRAMIMLIVMFGADVFGRKYDVLSAIAVALLIVLLQRPFFLMQPGFLLSFGAVLGIAWVKPVLMDVALHLPAWMEGLMVSLSVTVMTLPISLYFYFTIPIWSVLLNLIVIPCMTVLLGGLIICGTIGAICPAIARIVAYGVNGILAFYELLCEQSEKLPFHTLCTGRPSIAWIVIYYLLLLIFVATYNRVSQKARRKLTIIWIASTILLVGSCFQRHQLRICMMDVGQGDGFYISLPNRMNILIDGGSSSQKNVGKNVLLPSVQYFGAGSLDYVFVTHSDQDHDNGIIELILENQIQIKHLVLPAIAKPDESYLELVKMASVHNIEVSYMKCDEELRVGDISIRCLNPGNSVEEDKNNNSLCLWVQYRDFDMLFTGDMEEYAEGEVHKRYSKLQNVFEVLKVAHHGSDTSSGNDFIKWVKPQVSFVSVGPNRYGHPKDTVLKRIEDSEIYRTDQNGAVLLTTDGANIWVKPFKQTSQLEQESILQQKGLNLVK